MPSSQYVDLQWAIVISTPVNGSVPEKFANNVSTNSIFIIRLNATFYSSAHNLHFLPGFAPVELKIFLFYILFIPIIAFYFAVMAKPIRYWLKITDIPLAI